MAVFPGAVSTNSDLYIAVNQLSCLLTDNPLTIGATTVNVNTTTGFPSVGTISIDAEIIKYTGITATSFTGCTRGFDGTSAASHLVGAQVDHNVVAVHHNVHKDEIIAIEQNLSDRIGLGSTQLKTPAGSAAAPSHSFATDTDTGLFQVAPGLVQMAIDGTEYFRFAANVLLLTNSTVIQASVGSAALPSYTFSGDPDTGLYSNATNEFAVSTGGVVSTLFTSLGVNTSKVRLDDGTAALPAMTFQNDPDTGIYRSGANAFKLVTNGSPKLELDANFLYPVVQIQTIDGTQAAPAYSFFSDPDTGMYRAAANDLRLVTNGNTKLQIDANFIYPNAQIQTINGTAAAPAFSFFADPNTGIFWRSADSFGFSAGGTLRATLNTTGLSIDSGSLQILDGTVGSPSIQFGTDPDCGIYRVGANSWALAANGAIAIAIDSTGENFYAAGVEIANIRAAGISTINGTAAAPSFYFLNDTNTGFYRTGSDAIGVALGGALLFDFNVTVNRSFVTFQPAADNAYTLGSNAARWVSVHAVNGTIQTSMAATKENVEELWPEEPIECKVPMPVIFNRPGEQIDQRRLGWLADSLPVEAHPVIGRDEEGNVIRSTEDVYTDSILAMHSLALRNDYDRLADYKTRIEALEAKVAALEAE